VASGLYDYGREGFLGADIDWNGHKIGGVLVNVSGSGTLYTPNLTTHQFMSDIENTSNDLSVAAGARSKADTTCGNGQSASGWGSKTITAGIADAADITFQAVPGSAGLEYEALVIFAWTETNFSRTTARLVAYIDSASATGFPVTPNGGDIIVAFDSGTNKIYKL
jgi:hypothetical protein